VVRNGIADNVHFLYEAIKGKMQVYFRGYKSSHSHAVKDRLVEPFAFTANNNEIWCYEPESGKNKLFKVSRISNVEMSDSAWQFEAEHREGFIDVFHNSSDRRLPVTLRLGMAAANLLIEEFPLAEKHLSKEDETHWFFSADVCRYEGIGRFVIGLLDDIEIVDSPEFEDFLAKKMKKITGKIKV
jgi:predicted DNA-binding transcriptional regulator YafY